MADAAWMSKLVAKSVTMGNGNHDTHLYMSEWMNTPFAMAWLTMFVQKVIGADYPDKLDGIRGRYQAQRYNHVLALSEINKEMSVKDTNHLRNGERTEELRELKRFHDLALRRLAIEEQCDLARGALRRYFSNDTPDTGGTVVPIK